jgi:FAD/FMN-containing dehydrogenase
MSVTTPSANVPSTIDEQLRLRIAEQLAGQFKGEIIGLDHAEYERARTVWNAMIDRRPGLILRCTSTSDVVAAVTVAREHGLPPSVRCGGHNVAGKAMSDGGLTIDLSGLREVTVDAERKLVHVGGGCLLGDVDAATAPHRLIVPAGIMSETGVGGLALGGGIGWFSRKHGLTCDNFVSLELVLASGEVIEVSADSHPELFWALTPSSRTATGTTPRRHTLPTWPTRRSTSWSPSGRTCRWRARSRSSASVAPSATCPKPTRPSPTAATCSG